MPKKSNVYSIGKFAEISKMTINQLRYLDEKNVLKPNTRDASSKYRYYTYEQLEKLLCIRTLRELDMPLETIVKIHEANDLEFLLGNLTDNLVRVEDKMQQVLWEYAQNTLFIQEVIKGISILKGHQSTCQTVEMIEVPRMQVLSVRRNVEPHNTMVFADRFIELNDLCEKQRLHYDMGAYAVNHCSYLSQFTGNSIDLETMIPLKRSVTGHESVRIFGGFQGVSTVFVGPYEQMLPAYQECVQWAKENNVQVMEQSVEEYILASDHIMNPSQYITRLILPLEGSTL